MICFDGCADNVLSVHRYWDQCNHSECRGTSWTACGFEGAVRTLQKDTSRMNSDCSACDASSRPLLLVLPSPKCSWCRIPTTYVRQTASCETTETNTGDTCRQVGQVLTMCADHRVAGQWRKRTTTKSTPCSTVDLSRTASSSSPEIYFSVKTETQTVKQLADLLHYRHRSPISLNTRSTAHCHKSWC